MYKIRRVAEMLEVSTIQVHEKLIDLKDSLGAHVHKKSGVTYIDDKGLLLIKRAFDLIHAEEPAKDTEVDIIEESVEVEVSESNEVSDEVEITPVMLTEEEQSEKRVLDLKDDIGKYKTKLNKLDIELRKKDDAIKHYQEQLLKEMKQRTIAEDRLIKLYKAMD